MSRAKYTKPYFDFSLTESRRAAKGHRCSSCLGPVPKGAVHLVHTQFPGHDAGSASAAGHPLRSRECARCAIRYGRAELLKEKK